MNTTPVRHDAAADSLVRGDERDGPDMWLAGVYERNALGQAWLGFDVIAAATRFESRLAVQDALGVVVSGTGYQSRDPEIVARARAVLRPGSLLNPAHEPGQLAVFVQHVPQARGAAVLTFSLSDSDRSPESMCSALEPAASFEQAVDKLHAVLGAERYAIPVEDSAIEYLTGRPVEPNPESVRSSLLQKLHRLSPSVGYWHTYFGDHCVGILPLSVWDDVEEDSDRRRVARRLIGFVRRALAKR
jgi:hypothetical protein